MNNLYFGDNLDVLQQNVDPESVDLVYLDPPFNSQAGYNLLYETPGDQRESAQQTIFRDMWSWGDEADHSFQKVLGHGGQIAAVMNALTTALQRSDMMAYLAMMAARLIEIHRVMKPTASLYLHCDPTASHYLKIVLDAIFGPDRFLNEVIWKRTSAHSSAKRYGPVHDVLLFYGRGDSHIWNPLYQPYDPDYLATFFDQEDDDGRRWKRTDLTGAGTRNGETGLPWRGINITAKGRHWAYPPSELERLDRAGRVHWPTKEDGMPRLKQYPEDLPGVPLQDVWTDIRPLHNLSKQRLGYPTQKPLTLLERIIAASSKPGDVVLDPFCGCGTTVHAAQKLKRQWIGIDVSYYAVRLIQRRIRANFGSKLVIPISGIPADLASAEGLAEREPYGFQQWVVGELGCQLWNDGKKGRDSGIDGEMYFYNPPHNAGRLLVQVKGGKKAGAPMVREFKEVMNREKAALGIFFSRSEPTADMRREASTLGEVKVGGKTFRRLQLFHLGAWFAGQRPELPVPIELTIAQDRSQRRPRRIDPRQPQFAFVIEGKTRAEKGQVLNPDMLPDDALKAS